MMVTRTMQVMGGAAAVLLVVAALWAWGDAWRFADNAQRPHVALWAVRSGALAAVSGAQALLVTCVVGRIYPRRPIDQMMTLLAVLVCTIALVSAAALALAGR